MRWSIQELFRAWSYKKTHGNIFNKIFFTPGRVWKRLKVFLFWLFRGYTKEGLWDLNDLVLRDLEFRISKFIKQHKFSYPYGYDSPEEWKKDLIDFYEKLRNHNNEFYLHSGEALGTRVQNTTGIQLNGKTKQVEVLSWAYTDEEKEELKKKFEEQEKNDREMFEKLAKILRELWD